MGGKLLRSETEENTKSLHATILFSMTQYSVA